MSLHRQIISHIYEWEIKQLKVIKLMQLVQSACIYI